MQVLSNFTEPARGCNRAGKWATSVTTALIKLLDTHLVKTEVVIGKLF